MYKRNIKPGISFKKSSQPSMRRYHALTARVYDACARHFMFKKYSLLYCMDGHWF